MSKAYRLAKCGVCEKELGTNVWGSPTVYVERLADERNRFTVNGEVVHECERARQTVIAGDPLLTDEEREALALTAQLANLFGRIIGQGRSRSGDLNEAVTLIHGLQHMLMAQAAARAYPTEYRRMGEGLPDMEEPSPPAWNDLS